MHHKKEIKEESVVRDELFNNFILPLTDGQNQEKCVIQVSSAFDQGTAIGIQERKNPAYGQHSALSYMWDSGVPILYHVSKSVP